MSTPAPHNPSDLPPSSDPAAPGRDGADHHEAPAADHGAIAEQVIDVIAKEGMVDRARILPEATLESLDLKSIDIVVILTAIEEKFGVYIPIDGPLAEARDVRGFIDNVTAYISQQKQQA